MGSGKNDDALTPLVGKYVQVSTGDDYTCGLKRSGEVVCWGSFFTSQHEVPDEKFVGNLSSASRGSCAIKSDNTAGCWGSQAIAPPEGEFTQISSGGTHACGVTNGIIKCWGGSTEIPVPEADDNSTFVQVDAGYNFSCAVMSNNNIVCWEKDGTVVATPTGEYTHISVVFSHVCALGTDQKITCWGGNNDEGENDPQTDNFSQVTARVKDIAAESLLTGGIKCWGRDSLIVIP